MKLRMKLDLAGRVVTLLAVAWQVGVLSDYVSVRQRGDVLHLLENQHRLAMMISGLTVDGTPSEIGSGVADAYSGFALFSDWNKTPWNNYIQYSTVVFLFFFLSGSVLLIVARYLEFSEDQARELSQG